jgi:hypothetical protein
MNGILEISTFSNVIEAPVVMVLSNTSHSAVFFMTEAKGYYHIRLKTQKTPSKAFY